MSRVHCFETHIVVPDTENNVNDAEAIAQKLEWLARQVRNAPDLVCSPNDVPEILINHGGGGGP